MSSYDLNDDEDHFKFNNINQDVFCTECKRETDLCACRGQMNSNEIIANQKKNLALYEQHLLDKKVQGAEIRQMGRHLRNRNNYFYYEKRDAIFYDATKLKGMELSVKDRLTVGFARYNFSKYVERVFGKNHLPHIKSFRRRWK